MAITVCVLRSTLGDTTNGGVTARETTFTLLDENEPVPERGGPFLRLVRRHLFGDVYVHAEPVDEPVGKIGPMAGGNAVYTPGSRYRDLVGHRYPIPVHDRYETPAEYRLLSGD